MQRPSLVFALLAPLWIGITVSPAWACDKLDPDAGDDTTLGQIQRFTDCLWREHRFGDLIVFLEAHLDVAQTDVWLSRMLGMAYNVHGLIADALKSLQNAYDLDPQDPFVNEALAKVLVQRVIQISPRQAELRAASLGEQCRMPSGLAAEEAEALSRSYIEQARNLLYWLIADSENIHEQLQFRYELLDLDRLAGARNSDVAHELIAEMKNRFAQDPDERAREWLIVTLTNEANTSYGEKRLAEARDFARQAMQYANQPRLKRDVEKATGYLFTADPQAALMARISTSPCIIAFHEE